MQGPREGLAGHSPGTGTRTLEPFSLPSSAGLAVMPPGLVQCPQAPLGGAQLGQPLGVLPACSSVPSTCCTQQGGVSGSSLSPASRRGRGTAGANDYVLNEQKDGWGEEEPTGEGHRQPGWGRTLAVSRGLILRGGAVQEAPPPLFLRGRACRLTGPWAVSI